MVASGGNALLIAPTGTGKTLGGFLALLDKLLTEERSPGVACVYISPLKSLGADIRRNLLEPLQAVAEAAGPDVLPVSVDVRTGDTTLYRRSKQRKAPPQILVTTPESLAILLSQPVWNEHFKALKTIIVDEIHSLVPTKRGADLAVSLERLSAGALGEPQRIGLSATCRPAQLVADFLVGQGRQCAIIEPAPKSSATGKTTLTVESLIQPDEAAYRPLVHSRLIRRLKECQEQHLTTIVFTNTRPLTERIAFLLKEEAGPDGAEQVAAHHGSLDARLRQKVEADLKAGNLRMVVSSTSLELGVDYQSADFVVQVGQPGSVARCLQRLGRAGHGPGRDRNGVLLAAGPAELAGAVVTASAALEGLIEPVRGVENPLDVLCQQLVGMACANDRNATGAFETIRRSWPFRKLPRRDFDACLAYLAGELASPPGAFEPEPGAAPRWTSPRLWRSGDEFGVRHGMIPRWLRMNAGTIVAEESMTVLADGVRVGRLESSYAESLQPGDRFVLDGRSLEFQKLEDLAIQARPVAGESALPTWTSDRPGFSAELAGRLCQFRAELGSRLLKNRGGARDWLVETYKMNPADADGLISLWRSQLHVSEVPTLETVLVEPFPEPDGWAYAVHLGLHRGGAEAVGRAVAARLGREQGRDVRLAVADLGFAVHTQAQALSPGHIQALFIPEGLEADLLEGLEKGDLIARRFRSVAATGLMALRNTEGKRVRVGGREWVSRRLYPVVREACPEHPLVREARREALQDALDLPEAQRFLDGLPAIRVRTLRGPSPFAVAWIEPLGDRAAEPIHFESADEVMKRLHERLFSCEAGVAS